MPCLRFDIRCQALDMSEIWSFCATLFWHVWNLVILCHALLTCLKFAILCQAPLILVKLCQAQPTCLKLIILCQALLTFLDLCQAAKHNQCVWNSSSYAKHYWHLLTCAKYHWHPLTCAKHCWPKTCHLVPSSTDIYVPSASNTCDLCQAALTFMCQALTWCLSSCAKHHGLLLICAKHFWHVWDLSSCARHHWDLLTCQCAKHFSSRSHLSGDETWAHQAE